MERKLIVIYFAAHAVGLFWSRALPILSRPGNGDNRNPSSKTKATTDKTAPCRSGRVPRFERNNCALKQLALCNRLCGRSQFVLALVRVAV